MAENHASLIAMMERSFGKSVVVDAHSTAAIANGGTMIQIPPDPTKTTGSSRLQGD
ncbi:hypothetical protein A2U01_0118542, partial [Trifolium medium]|nr:hypothetical protein [Trifolium medium]